MSFMKPVMAIAAICVAMLAMTGLARSKKASKRRHGMMRRGHSR
jgi:hypothetical protein